MIGEARASAMRVIDSVRTGQKFVVLDVDRTLFNTTSWYHACTCEDLLIPAGSIATFEALNARAFGLGRDLPLDRFRAQTLALLEHTISSRFIERIGGLEQWADLFRVGVATDELRLFVAGRY